jgi:hypothetical protein
MKHNLITIPALVQIYGDEVLQITPEEQYKLTQKKFTKTVCEQILRELVVHRNLVLEPFVGAVIDFLLNATADINGQQVHVLHDERFAEEGVVNELTGLISNTQEWGEPVNKLHHPQQVLRPPYEGGQFLAGDDAQGIAEDAEHLFV